MLARVAAPTRSRTHVAVFVASSGHGRRRRSARVSAGKYERRDGRAVYEQSGAEPAHPARAATEPHQTSCGERGDGDDDQPFYAIHSGPSLAGAFGGAPARDSLLPEWLQLQTFVPLLWDVS